MTFCLSTFNLLGLLFLLTASSASGRVEANDSSFEAVRLEMLRGNLDKALETMKTESSQGSLDNVQINVLQGFFFKALGKPKEAIDNFRVVINEEPSVPAIVYVGLADALLRLGKLDEARINLRKAFLIEPLSVAARVLDLQMDREKRGEEATIKAFIHAQEDTGYAEEVDIAFARFLVDNASSQADLFIAQMLRRRSDNPYLIEKSGQAQFLAGLFGQANNTFEKASARYKEVGDEFNFNRLENWLIASELKTKEKKKKDNVAHNKSALLGKKDVLAQKTDATDSDKNHAEIKRPSVALRKSTKQEDSVGAQETDLLKVKSFQNQKPILTPQAIPDPIVVSKDSKVSTGSGFITNSGKWVITNRHVVENWKSVQVRNGLGQRRLAKEIRFDHHRDLAIIELAEPYASDLSHKLSDIVDPKVGESVFVIGFPLAQIFGSQYPSISTGIVSSNYGYMESDSQFQVTAKMNPGNSGGPVFNQNGQVIGVAVAKLDKKAVEKASGNILEDVNFALKGSNILDLAKYEVSNPLPRASMKLDAEEIYAQKRPSVVVVVTETD